MGKVALAGVWVLLLSGCASGIIGTQEWFDQHSYGKQALAKKASFDLSCPAADLEFVCIGNDCTSAGATGCDKKASYVFVENKWVMNSDSQPAK
ncbi:MAG: hypothetical protein HOW73_40435 [Polyangiaceae bacterium]|nr:hypothetical protein [Polyangiaceae bacterium]